MSTIADAEQMIALAEETIEAWYVEAEAESASILQTALNVTVSAERLLAEARAERELAGELVAEATARLHAAAAEGEEQLRGASFRRDEILRAAGAEREEVLRGAGAEREEILRAAGAERDKILRSARAERDEILRAARAEREAATRTLAGARAEGEALVGAARRDAEVIRAAEAEVVASRLREAGHTASALIAEAEAEAKAIRRGAQDAAERAGSRPEAFEVPDDLSSLTGPSAAAEQRERVGAGARWRRWLHRV